MKTIVEKLEEKAICNMCGVSHGYNHTEDCEGFGFFWELDLSDVLDLLKEIGLSEEEIEKKTETNPSVNWEDEGIYAEGANWANETIKNQIGLKTK